MRRWIAQTGLSYVTLVAGIEVGGSFDEARDRAFRANLGQRQLEVPAFCVERPLFGSESRSRFSGLARLLLLKLNVLAFEPARHLFSVSHSWDPASAGLRSTRGRKSVRSCVTSVPVVVN